MINSNRTFYLPQSHANSRHSLAKTPSFELPKILESTIRSYNILTEFKLDSYKIATNGPRKRLLWSRGAQILHRLFFRRSSNCTQPLSSKPLWSFRLLSKVSKGPECLRKNRFRSTTIPRLRIFGVYKSLKTSHDVYINVALYT